MDKRIKIYKIQLLALAIGLTLVAGIFSSNTIWAKTAKEIDAGVDATLARFYKQVEGGDELAKSSKGMLVMPNVVKGALLIGAEYGEGALRINGETVDYYNLVSGSFGFQIGGQAKDIILLFMNEDVLKQFQASKGWEAGIDGNVALIKVGEGQRLDTRTARHSIVGLVIDVKGLILDISLKGAKFTKIDR